MRQPEPAATRFSIRQTQDATVEAHRDMMESGMSSVYGLLPSM
jgi:hypothetical protein